MPVPTVERNRLLAACGPAAVSRGEARGPWGRVRSRSGCCAGVSMSSRPRGESPNRHFRPHSRDGNAFLAAVSSHESLVRCSSWTRENGMATIEIAVLKTSW